MQLYRIALVANIYSVSVISLCTVPPGCHSCSTVPSAATEKEEKVPYSHTCSQTRVGI